MAQESQQQGFQFVTVTRPGHDWKSGNEHIVRSHVMRQVRRQQKLRVTEKVATKPRSVKSRVSNDGRRGICRCQHSLQSTLSTCNEDSRSLWTEIDKNSGSSNKVCAACAHRFSDDRWILEQPSPLNQRLSFEEQRLLDHITNFFSPVVANTGQKFLLWTKGVIMFMAIAESHDFVLHALLGWSAAHLAPAFKDRRTELDAYRHQNRALRGLQNAIASFSKDNADAILCASIIISWQSTDARSWANVIRGCQSVKAKMATLKKTSSLDNVARESLSSNSDDLFDNTFLDSPRNLPPQSHQNQECLVKECLKSLALLQESAEDMGELKNGIEELTTFLHQFQEAEYQSKSRTERLRPLKDMLYWFQRRYLQKLNSHPLAMVLMAHSHACALFIEPAEDSDTAYFRRLNASPIQSFHEEFCTKSELETKAGQSDGEYQRALMLLEFPVKVMDEFQTRLNYSSSDRSTKQIPGIIHTRHKESNLWYTHKNLSIVQILESCPVGLWHNSLV